MSLQEEIDAQSCKIYRDAYQMSIGELINLYVDGELDIHPEFQRFFRWTPFQKTRLIESIVLNIPIPPIFVSQNEDGIWDVIDGVQRLSTIFQFVGVYHPEEGSSEPESFELEATEYLPSFEKMSWNSEDSRHCFTTSQKINFKRARIDIIIVKKESDKQSKYELFQRLNTGGSRLSTQEIRNCLIIMSNREYYNFFTELADNEKFDSCVPISERLKKEKYKTELVLRLLIGVLNNSKDLQHYKDITDLLDRETLILCSSPLDMDDLRKKFVNTFEILSLVEGEDIFKRRKENEKPKGAFISAAYQGIATGLMYNIEFIRKEFESNHSKCENWLKDRVRRFYLSDTFEQMTGPGIKPSHRYLTLSSFGKNFFDGSSYEDFDC